jgi:putative transcriptional regulator
MSHIIKAIRAREHLTQHVFARYLNVSKNLVSNWECSIKKRSELTLRLLAVIQGKGLATIA